MIDTSIIKYTNQGRYFLQQRNIKCIDQNNIGKVQNFIKSSKSSSTSNSGNTSLSPIGDSFWYVETSQNISGSENVFVGFESTDKIQLSIISF